MSVSLIDGHIDDDAPRMTDNEIIKAFRCCYLNEDECEDCPCFKDGNCTDVGAVFNTVKQILDLIDRQKAEIKRLEHIKEAIAILAVKEFAERLNKEAENVGIDREGDFLYSDSDNTAFEIYNTVAEWCNEVANTILKEMVGDTK